MMFRNNENMFVTYRKRFRLFEQPLKAVLRMFC